MRVCVWSTANIKPDWLATMWNDVEARGRYIYLCMCVHACFCTSVWASRSAPATGVGLWALKCLNVPVPVTGETRISDSNWLGCVSAQLQEGCTLNICIYFLAPDHHHDQPERVTGWSCWCCLCVWESWVCPPVLTCVARPVYVCCTCVCVPIGNACSSLLPVGPEGKELWQPHIYLAAGCVPTSLTFWK